MQHILIVLVALAVTVPPFWTPGSQVVLAQSPDHQHLSASSQPAFEAPIGMDQPPPGPPGHRRRPGPPGPPLDRLEPDLFPTSAPDQFTPQQQEQLLAFIAEHFPTLHEHLKAEQGPPPARLNRLLRKLWPLYTLYNRDPQLGQVVIDDEKLEFRIRQLVRTYATAADDQQRDALRDQLREALEQQFDLRAKRRELELQELEAKLDEQRQQLTELQQSRQQLLQARLERLTRPRPPAEHQP
jgi:hypothetical protein